ncbi:MAG TPA: hypothetical protein GXZ22_06360 [Clostridiaceae bacterium]|nr:hypothetical protein [Clostridiaceae bacterium]
MDEFYCNSNYSSGWRRIKREDAEKEQQKPFDILQQDPGALTYISKQVLDNTTSMNKRAVGNTSSMLTLEEKQKEIIDKINQLQVEMTTMKELLSNIQSNTEMIKGPGHKNTTGSKLSRFFK